MTHMVEVETFERGTILWPSINRYLGIVAFGAIWTIANIAGVDFAFQRTFGEQPYHILRIFGLS